MEKVFIGDLAIGEGSPKICVPVFGNNEIEILEAAGEVAAEADLVELRLDYYEDCMNLELVKTILDMVHKQVGKPLLVTLRTKTEGGEIDISPRVYCEYIAQLIKIGGFELIDIELFQADDKVEELIEEARKQNIKVILSNHDFVKTPDKEELLLRILRMEYLGADIAKIAVMSQSVDDLLKVLEVTNLASTRYAHIPVVTMAMGKIGVLSRISGGIFGSAITFGIGAKSSAPGQVEAKELKSILRFIETSGQ